MKSFKKFVEECKQAENINEAEFNQAWWNSKSDNFKKRYIEKHPNSIYAKKFGNGKLDKQIASKKYHADAGQKRFERDVAGNKSWMRHMAKRGLDKDRRGDKPLEALTPRYRKNLIRGAEDRFGKDSKQAARARELWGDNSTTKAAPKPNKRADVSDIISGYKKKMAAAGPRASIKKTDRIEADAIKEFMTRKIGAGRPYDDYYNYWLHMDPKTQKDFNEIYHESEARERAFSELSGTKYWLDDPEFLTKSPQQTKR